MFTSQFKFNIYLKASRLFHYFFGKYKWKYKFEWFFWKWQFLKEKQLSNDHYKFFFTSYFNLPEEYYIDKKVLDIGCGPRGSLEWANQTKERVGIDPLIEKYALLGIDKHDMTYKKCGAEDIIFPDEYFDVVSSFNSLDHVDDLEKSIKEIKRVIKKGGLFLLIADIHKEPTICEPSGFDWEILKSFSPEFEVLQKGYYRGSGVYRSIREGITLNVDKEKHMHGVITALMRRL